MKRIRVTSVSTRIGRDRDDKEGSDSMDIFFYSLVSYRYNTTIYYILYLHFGELSMYTNIKKRIYKNEHITSQRKETTTYF